MFVQNESQYMLFPYSKDLFYHPSGVLSMTLEIFSKDGESHEFSFGFEARGVLREFLDNIYEGAIDPYEEED